jgi:hypothetical protein
MVLNVPLKDLSIYELWVNYRVIIKTMNKDLITIVYRYLHKSRLMIVNEQYRKTYKWGYIDFLITFECRIIANFRCYERETRYQKWSYTNISNVMKNPYCYSDTQIVGQLPKNY